MTDREILELIVTRLDNIENEVKDRFDNIENEVRDFKCETKDRFDNIENEIRDFKGRFNKLERQVDYTTAMLESEVDKMVDLLGEGYQASFEKIDSLNIDSIKSKITRLELL